MKLKIERQNIQTFINALLLEGIEGLEIFLPMLGITYAKVSFSTQCRLLNIVSEPVYSNAYNRTISNIKKRAKREVPSYMDALRCLVQSGDAFENHHEIIGIVNSALDRSPLRGDRTLFFAFDTNSLIDRVYSNFLRNIISSKIQEVGFVISEEVRNELSFHGKYSESESREIISIEGFKKNDGVVKGVIGQNRRIDRTKRIGYLELLKLQSDVRLENVLTKEEKSMQDENIAADQKILCSYRHFAMEKQSDILLLTGDDTVIGGGKGLPGVRICPLIRRRSYLVPSECEYDVLCNLIYILALTFLVVDIRADRKYLGQFLGLWEGKQEEDWLNEKVLLFSEHSAAKSTITDIDILKGIEKHV